MKMKRIIVLLTVMLAGMTAVMAAPVDVSNADAFRDAVMEDPGAEIHLTDNIDVSALGTIVANFTGSIDGLAFVEDKDTVFSIYKDHSRTKNFVPLFGNMKNARISNLVVSGFRVQSESEYNMGALAHTMDGCEVENVTLLNVSAYTNEDNAGAIAGTAANCSFKNVKCLNCDATVDGICAGGLVGSSKSCTFTQCMNNVKSWVFADGTAFFPNSAYAGGITGLSENDSFENCYNFGLIGANDDAVGGICGHSTGSTFLYCVNSGCAFHVDEETFHSNKSEIMSDIESRIRSCRAIWVSGFGSVIAGPLIIVSVPFWILETFPPVAIATAIGVAIVGTAMTIYGLMEGYDELGGICGSAIGGQFSCCYNYGTCMARDEGVGGIVGQTENGVRIVNCLNAGHVQGSIKVGGITGHLKGSSMNNCLNVGSVKADYENDFEQGDNNWGCLFAIDPEDKCSWNNNYFKSSVYDPTSGGRIKVTDKQLVSGEVAWWLNQGQENGPWRQNIGEDRNPVLDPEHKLITHEDLDVQIRIKSADELVAFAKQVNGRSNMSETYVVFLDADIDMNGRGNWTPIGTQSKPFYGMFFGGGHTIDNLQCNVTAANTDAGLFGTLGMRSEIHDVTLGAHSSITSSNNAVGGIAGCVRVPDGNIGAVRISGCTNMAKVTGKYNVGGILGAVYNDTKLQLTISDCCNAGMITATGTNGADKTGESAAICGYCKDNAVITDCWNLGPVGSSSASVQGYKTGYFFVYGNSPDISNCYNFEGFINEKSAQKGVEPFSALDYVDGTLCYNLNNRTNNTLVGLRWQQEIGEGNDLIYTGFGSHGKGIYLPNRTSARSGVVVLPYDAASTDSLMYCMLDSVRYDVTKPVVRFRYVDVLPAGTPAFFFSETGADFDFLSVGEDIDYSRTDTVSVCGMSMTGTFTDRSVSSAEVSGSLYVFDNDMVKQADGSVDVGEYGAFFMTEAMSDIQEFFVEFYHSKSNPHTLVEPVRMSEGLYPELIFDFQGRRINGLPHGIGIVRTKDGRTVKVLSE